MVGMNPQKPRNLFTLEIFSPYGTIIRVVEHVCIDALVVVYIQAELSQGLIDVEMLVQHEFTISYM